MRKIVLPMVVAFFLVAFVRCVSYPIASREGRPTEPLNLGSGQAALSFNQCRPISAGFYVVQAGVFKKIANAQALRKRLEERGYPSSLTVSGFEEERRVFRVLVGRFAEIEEAQRVAEDIKTRERVDAIAVLKPPRDTYVVQAGCFHEMSAAKALRKTLADRGRNAYIILSGTGSEEQYAVILGEFIKREEAEKVAREIRENENIHAFVNTQ